MDIQKILVMGTSGRYVKDALGNRTTSLAHFMKDKAHHNLFNLNSKKHDILLLLGHQLWTPRIQQEEN